MVSAIDRAKRALVTLLKSLATVYGLVLSVTRDAPDKDVRTAYRKVSRKAHPDHGGSAEHQTALNNAHDAWQEAIKASKGWGGSTPKAQETVASVRQFKTGARLFQSMTHFIRVNHASSGPAVQKANSNLVT